MEVGKSQMYARRAHDAYRVHARRLPRVVAMGPWSAARDRVRCEFCDRIVHVTLPPVFETTADRWHGSADLRVRPHWWLGTSTATSESS